MARSFGRIVGNEQINGPSSRSIGRRLARKHTSAPLDGGRRQNEVMAHGASFAALEQQQQQPCCPETRHLRRLEPGEAFERLLKTKRKIKGESGRSNGFSRRDRVMIDPARSKGGKAFGAVLVTERHFPYQRCACGSRLRPKRRGKVHPCSFISRADSYDVNTYDEATDAGASGQWPTRGTADAKSGSEGSSSSSSGRSARRWRLLHWRRSQCEEAPRTTTRATKMTAGRSGDQAKAPSPNKRRRHFPQCSRPGTTAACRPPAVPIPPPPPPTSSSHP